MEHNTSHPKVHESKPPHDKVAKEETADLTRYAHLKDENNQRGVMKTSVIEVRGMLSSLSAYGVEKRIGKLLGVKSVTVNYAAGSATVRYDETRLEIADIKAAVHQCGYQCEGDFLPRHVSEHKPAHKQAVEPIPEAVPISALTSAVSTPKAPLVAPVTMPVPAAPAVDAPAAAAVAAHEGHATPGKQPSTPVAAAPKASHVSSAAVPVPAAPADDAPAAPAVAGHEGHAAHGTASPCRQIWRLRWVMAARIYRPWSVICATVSGSA